MKRFFLLLPAFLCLFSAFAQQKGINKDELEDHIEYLASDRLKGRGTGEKGEQKAGKYIARQFRKIGLQPKGNDGFYYNFTFKKSTDPHGNVPDSAPVVQTRNIAGFLDNGAPATIIIGAHYDHLGLGHDRNSLDANPAGKIHNGADDNASGTAGVIELARYLVKNGVKEKYNYLFLCFSGEELGLVGSKKYCENPTIDLSTVNCMLNMDMIGRLTADRGLVVGGVGTAPDFVPLIQAAKPPFHVKQDSSGVGPSDHTSFYLKNIPVLFFFTGQHSDYHKPTDDVDKINFDGEEQVLNYAIDLLREIDARPRLKFQQTQTKDNGTPRFKVTMGIMPDYTFEGKGVRVDGVTEGKPAAKAGLQRNDIILLLGDKEVGTVQDYMRALSGFQKGDTATIKVKRGNDTLELKVTF